MSDDDFKHEVEMLRAWRLTAQPGELYAYWWSEPGIAVAMDAFLSRVPPHDWSGDDIADLLFVLDLAPGSDFAQRATRTEPMALALARHSLARGGMAGAAIAEQLGQGVQHRGEAEALLLQFMSDAHERTRRMALFSLAQLRSGAVPGLVADAWALGDEHHRIVALSALKTAASDLLPGYLAKALADGRARLVSKAREYGADGKAGPTG